MRPMLATILVATLALSACQTVTPEERRARDEAECRSYGFSKQNDAFAACLQRIELDRREQRRDDLRRLDPWPGYPRSLIVYR